MQIFKGILFFKAQTSQQQNNLIQTVSKPKSQIILSETESQPQQQVPFRVVFLVSGGQNYKSTPNLNCMMIGFDLDTRH